jgi:hypothetical protein
VTFLDWIGIFSAAACGTIVGGVIVALVVAGYIGAGFKIQPPAAPRQ